MTRGGRDGDERTHMEARAEGYAVIYQSGRDIHLRFDTTRRSLPAGAIHDCPYPGLAPFEPGQSQWFFGRDELIAGLIARLDRRQSAGGLQMVIAPSGAGKSSLLQAGLLPRLAQAALPGSQRWPVLLCTPTADPLHALAVPMGSLTNADPGVIAAELADDPASCVRRLRRALDARTGGRDPADRVVVVVDQCEELFTLCLDEDRRQTFVEVLSQLATSTGPSDPPVAVVVVAVRADFHAACGAMPALRSALEDAPLVVGPMSAEQVRQAILYPAQTAALDVEPGLIDILLNELGVSEGSRAAGGTVYDAGRLPMLAHALRMTWQQRHGSTLTVDGYRHTGGIQNAIAVTAEQVYSGLAESSRQQVRSLLLYMIRVGDGTADVRRRASRSELADTFHTAAQQHATMLAVEAFAAARLLTLDHETMEITHEALLSGWPRLRDWISEERASQLIRQSLEETASVWNRRSQDPSLLYRGTQLEAARTWAAAAAPGHLSRLGTQFLAGSIHADLRGRRRRTGYIAALVVLVLVAGGAAVLARRQLGEAERQRDLVMYNQLLSTADRLAATDMSVAAQFVLAAHRMNPGPETVTKLNNAAHAPLSRLLGDAQERVCAAAFHPNGKILATGDDNYRVQLWDLTVPSQPVPVGPQLTGHSGSVCALAFSPDGKTLATGSTDKTVRLWDLTDPARPASRGKPLTGYHGAVNTVSFSPDGTLLATGSSRGSGVAPITDPSLWLWNVTNPTAPSLVAQALTGGGEVVNTLAFHPDGRGLAVGTGSLTRMWSVADPAKPTPISPPLGDPNQVIINVIAFSPDGNTMAIASREQWIQLWSLADRRQPKPLSDKRPSTTGGATTMAFSHDSTTLAVGYADSSIRLWNVTGPNNPTQLGGTLTGHTGPVNTLAFHPDGRTLISGNINGPVRLWHLPPRLLLGNNRPYRLANVVEALAYSPDGHTLATATSDKLVRLADPLIHVLSGHTLDVCSVAYSPDGRTLASGAFGGTVRLWDVTTPENHSTLSELSLGHDSNVCTLAFSPDGRTLATGSLDGTAQLWDVTDPARPIASGRPLISNGAMVHAVAFSPNGHTLAVGTGNGIRLWNVTNPGKATVRGGALVGHTDSVSGIAFSPDGTTLASGSSDNTVQLWNVANADRPTARGHSLTGHAARITAVAYSPDGRTLASGSIDDTIHLWNVANPDQPEPFGTALIGHTAAVRSLEFSPDGHTLASGGSDQTVLLREMDIDRNIQQICTATAALMTAELWHRETGDMPYRPACPGS